MSEAVSDTEPLLLSFLEEHDRGPAAGIDIVEPAGQYARRPPRLVWDPNRLATALTPGFGQLFHGHPEKALITLRDTWLVGITSFITPQADGRMLLRNCYTTTAADTRTLVTRDAGSYAQLCSGLYLKGERIALPRSKLAEAERIERRVLFATCNEPHHWGLWLLETLPTLMRIRTMPERFDRVLVHVNHPNMRSTLELLGIEPSLLIEHHLDRAYHFQQVTIPRWYGHDFHVAAHERAVFGALVNASVALHPETKRRVFLSRRSRGGYRQLLNEAEVVAAFEALGFAAIEPEFMSAAEQIATFAQAEMVAGLGGGSLFNTVFCRPGTPVLSLDRSALYLPAHSNLFASAGLDYGYVVGTPGADRDNPNGDWTLDVASALPAVRRFFGL